MRTDSRSGLAFSSRGGGLGYEYRLKKTHHFFVKTKATIHYHGSEPGFTLQWKVCGVNKTYLRSQFICNTAVVAVQEKKKKKRKVNSATTTTLLFGYKAWLSDPGRRPPALGLKGKKPQVPKLTSWATPFIHHWVLLGETTIVNTPINPHAKSWAKNVSEYLRYR